MRGYSGFGDSFVYVIFADGTDLYWARSRVLEYLSQIAPRLPPQAQPALGPDATGVGWVYEYALVDRGGHHDLAQLRSLQDWFLKYELQSVPGVAEVATVGGMVKQYQVVLDPNRLRAYGLPLAQVRMAIQNANQEVGGSVIEMAEAEYMVRSRGYLQTIEDLRRVPLAVSPAGTPILLGDVAEVRVGPQLRLGAAELDGEGEVVGGIIVMRSGENALTTIEAVKAKLDQLRRGLPEGVEIVPAYDRSGLILRAVANLRDKLVEEFVVVVIVCALFLFHLRSSLVILFSLPVGILAAFAIMRWQGINANILSLGGIAIAIGAMVDAAIVMVENLHKHLEHAAAGPHPSPPGPPPLHSLERGAGGVRSIRRTLAHRAAGRRRSRAAAVFLPADHHLQLPAGIRPGGAGRADVRAAGLHQDLRHGGGGRTLHHPGAGADGLVGARPSCPNMRTRSIAC